MDTQEKKKKATLKLILFLGGWLFLGVLAVLFMVSGNKTGVDERADISFSFDTSERKKPAPIEKLKPNQKLNRAINVYSRADEERTKNKLREEEASHVSFGSVFKNQKQEKQEVSPRQSPKGIPPSAEHSITSALSGISVNHSPENSIKNNKRENEAAEVTREINKLYKNGGKSSHEEVSTATPSKEDELQRRKRELEGFNISNDNLTQEITPNKAEESMLFCCVHGEQTIKNNGRVTMRLLKAATINQEIIPRNTIIFGVLTFSGTRARVAVKSIRMNDTFISVTLNGYGSDGMIGLPLNVNAVEKEINDETTDEINRSIRNTQIGRTPIGAILNGAVSTMKREKNLQIILIDAQKITLR